MKIDPFGWIARLRRDQGGVAVVEFGLAAPLLALLGLTGVETANLVLAHLRVSQAALALADNASRIGIDSDLSVKQVQEREVNEVLLAANMQSGSMNLFDHGRVILSSLQVNADGGQWIKWQRCKGLLRADSSYGKEGDGSSGTGLDGMGPEASRIRAVPASAVMFVEVWYDYQPIIAPTSLAPQRLHYNAAFTVRDRRDLTALYNAKPQATPSKCDVYSAS